MRRLQGKTAIVTGGSVGIGRACATRFAEAGAGVMIADVLDEEGRALVAELEAATRALVPLDAAWHAMTGTNHSPATGFASGHLGPDRHRPRWACGPASGMHHEGAPRL